MDTLFYNNLLQNAFRIIDEHENQLDTNGNRFNIFSILDLETKEVRLHSNFIGELLDSKGSHTFGNTFCKLFFKELQQFNSKIIISDFNLDNYKVEVEKYVGLITEDGKNGGRIDIILSDNSGKQIIFENKIFASDQRYQLLRYYNYNKNSLLLYLTLNGTQPSLSSTNNELKFDIDYFCISYNNLIISWLEKCIKHCVSKPRIKETINQYLNLIQNYTDQNINSIKMEQLIKLLSEKKENFISVDDIKLAYDTLRQRINTIFINNLKSEMPPERIILLRNGIDVRYEVEQDNEGLYFGVFLLKDGVELICNESIYDEYYKILISINPNFIRNHNYIGWLFYSRFKYIWKLNNDEIFDLLDDNKRMEQINEIKFEFLNYVQLIKDKMV